MWYRSLRPFDGGNVEFVQLLAKQGDVLSPEGRQLRARAAVLSAVLAGDRGAPDYVVWDALAGRQARLYGCLFVCPMGRGKGGKWVAICHHGYTISMIERLSGSVITHKQNGKLLSVSSVDRMQVAPACTYA